ncbi:MAG: 3-deoxy-D-manno-octulosonic acid transferase [Chitinophagales bacterium]|nr:3-deoxy-D-manno-octulosonic acid transferase [Chitinophagales bacterium]
MNLLALRAYSLGIFFYSGGILIASSWNKKAKQWVQGRKNQGKIITSLLNKDENRVWFHCASAGEFEQGRPVIEAYRKQFPLHKIILTFFSPSGYELFKNYKGADYIFYLPVDTPQRAKQFVLLLQPQLALFIKYEYWFNILYQLSAQKIPLLLVSGVFRKEHFFFKWYGRPFREILSCFNKIFVQDENSFLLLNEFGIANAEISGDTRLDRVWKIAESPVRIPMIEKFKGHEKVFVAGSTWEEDETILFPLIGNDEFWKWIIAPHEINYHHLRELKNRWGEKVIFFSEATDENINHKDFLIVDKIGLLSSVYQYANLAYVGGGFGKGIHNILEAAVYGIPVLFGPQYHKFTEAKELLLQGEVRSVQNDMEMNNAFTYYKQEKNAIKAISNKNYIAANKGATTKIMNYISQLETYKKYKAQIPLI